MFCLERLGYKSSLVTIAGFDTVLKDVGANSITHLKANNGNVHSCCPVLDSNDAIHRAYFLNEHLQPTRTNSHRQLYQKYLNADMTVICNNLTQYKCVYAVCV